MPDGVLTAVVISVCLCFPYLCPCHLLPLAKEAVVAIGISQETDLDAEDVEDDEEEKSSKRRKDAVVYFSDDGSIASPARRESKEFVKTFGQGRRIDLMHSGHLKW